MRTDKLYYQIFLTQPALLAELIPGLPTDCEFEYIAPVVKESEFRLDGLLMPLTDNPEVPVIFIEAQMQADQRFYGRYFAETHLYLYQYQIERPWRGLLILRSQSQNLGREVPYATLLDNQVQRLYLNDLRKETELPLSLALLRLIVLPDASLPNAAKQVLEQAKGQGESAFNAILDSLEAILINRFPQFTTEEILAMLDLKMTDIRQTRFYQEVFAEGREEGREAGREEGREAGREAGREEGREEGEAAALLRLLTRRFGPLPEEQVAHIRGLRLPQLEALLDVVLDLADGAALAEWLAAHPVARSQAADEF
jgi:predicted transposase/invertase (TIGR01784 family)